MPRVPQIGPLPIPQSFYIGATQFDDAVKYLLGSYVPGTGFYLPATATMTNMNMSVFLQLQDQ